MRKLLYLVLGFFICVSVSYSQAPQKLNSAEIHQAIKKLGVLGSVLYIAAHPDDENTRLISYMANEVNARTAYLSITRGDGGQNLIGPELKELLGIIRTQELLAARNIDGGEQLFTRAIDFGYTKTPEEALEYWGEDEILSDVVWAIRTFKPDIIINRFDHRTSGETHGQHTASALLSVEAFGIAGDPSKFPQQLEHTELYSPQRLYFNTSPWFYNSEEEFQEANKEGFLTIDTGVYFPSKGLSNPEVAALSRSEHQSQGFGSSGSRGEQPEYLEILQEKPGLNPTDLFGGIDTSWGRVKNGKPIGDLIQQIEREYDFKDPSASLPRLVEAYNRIQKLEDSHWKKVKTEDLKEIIAAAAGLFLEAAATTSSATPSQKIQLDLEAINRSPGSIVLSRIELEPNNSNFDLKTPLRHNRVWKERVSLQLNEKVDYTSPYWLEEKGSDGRYKVKDQELIGLPEAPRKVKAKFILNIEGTELTYERPVIYKYTDPIKGEVYRPFEIIPAVSAKFSDDVLVFANGSSREVPLTITSGKDSIAGEVKFNSPGNWKIEPLTEKFEILKKGESVTLNIKVTPPPGPAEDKLTPVMSINGNQFREELKIIDYGHIPLQKIVLPAETKLIKLNIEKKGQNIGFIEGAGDVVPQSLEQIGYNVTRIDPATMTASSLQEFDAVVLGIRAFNTIQDLKYTQPALLEYTQNGGTVIVQYTVSRGIVVDQIGPYKLNISRDRVTREDAAVEFLEPEHPLLTTPNKITHKDFEGWVQERGLYFANTWAQEYTPILAMNDPNEPPRHGSLLVAKYGKGHFIYTGLSFFRQFPEGVSGAYRLFANMVSIGK